MADPSSTEAPTVQEGCVVADKFRLERVLGEGGMGVVYAAVHLDLRKHVAIKIVRDELATRDDAVDRMMNEARTAASLRSEHVARVLDVGRLPTGAPFIVMEYLEGFDLGAHLGSEGPLAPELAVSFVLQACEAVAEAHAAGIVHRDIKPENLFVATRADGEPMIKVLDFGIARNLGADRRIALTNPRAIVGSPGYMAPEAMRSQDQIGPASDVWSLGAVLFELLSGTRPFDGDTIPEVCARVLDDEPADLLALAPHVPPGLAAVIGRCLRKNPADRFAGVPELAAALVPHGGPGAADLARRVGRVGAGLRLRPRPAPEDGGGLVSRGSSPSSPRAALVTTLGDAGGARPSRIGSRALRSTVAGAAILASTVGGVLVLGGGAPPTQGDVAADAAAEMFASRDGEARAHGGAAEAIALDAAPPVLHDAPAIAPVVEVAPPASAAGSDRADATPGVAARPTAPEEARPRRSPARRSARHGGGPGPAAAATPPAASADASPDASSAPAADAPPDAWDPDAFGGRR